MDNRIQFPPTDVSQGFCSVPNSTPAAPRDRPTFTFIDHDDDLTSKKIRNANARKTIRSHVMRDVRRRERLAGMKRATKRDDRSSQVETAETTEPAEPAERAERAGATSTCFKPEESTEHSLALRASSSYSPSTPSMTPDLERNGDVVARTERHRPAIFLAGRSPSPSPSSPSPQFSPLPWLLDPFSTLPGSNETPHMVAHLVFYYKSVFAPMTFPNEQKVSQQAETELMVKSAFTDPGSFFGLMSMCAAHRAILAGRHSDLMDSSTNSQRVLHDPDYYIMKANCIRAVNDKMRDPSVTLSDETFDTIINLLISTLVVGLFDEARIHLTGLKRMVELRGGIADDSIRCSSMLAAILMADVKCASGLMLKPVFPLTWDSQPVPLRVQQRIQPLGSSTLNKLGSALFANDLISSPLKKILYVLHDLILFSQANKDNPTGLFPEDHDFFRLLNCEAEHQLLSYTNTEHGMDSPRLNPIEAVARVTCICYLNHFMIVSPPSSGLGRALTKHLKNAINCTLPLLARIPPENSGLLAWASFIGAQGSAGQSERPWFTDGIARIARIRGWQHWEQVCGVLAEYFYVPSMHDAAWRIIWAEAMGEVVQELEA